MNDVQTTPEAWNFQ